MAEINENAVSSDEISIVEDATPRYSAKTTEYLSFPMLLLIFKYLSIYDLLLRVGLVCKSWYHVARDRELWMTVDLAKQQKLKPRDLLKLLSFSNFRIIELDLPHCPLGGRFSVQEERLLILLLRKCQCLRVLQMCRLCWRSLSTDDVQEANSSLEIKFDCCTDHSSLGYLNTFRHLPFMDIAHSRLGCPCTFRHFPFEHIVCLRRESPIDYDPFHVRPSGFPSMIGTYGTSFGRSFFDHNRNLMERRIILQKLETELKIQDGYNNSNPKPSFQPYSKRQARKYPRQNHELRPPVNIVKQTKRYHQPKKGQIKRSEQKCIKQ